MHTTSRYGAIFDILQRDEKINEEVNLDSAPLSISVRSVEDINQILPFLTKDLGPAGLVLSALSSQCNQQSDGADADVSDSDKYIGSPLKLESCVDYAQVNRHIAENSNKIRVLHEGQLSIHPLPSRLARECLSAALLSATPSASHSLVLCFCDPADDNDKTLAVGCCTHTGARQLLNISYEEITQGSCKERFTKILREWQQNTIEPTHVTTKASAEYQLMSMSSTLIGDSSADEAVALTSSSAISINVDWSNVDTLLMVPPPDAVASLSINVVCGDKSSMVYCLYEELEYLKNLVTGLSTGRAIWPAVERTVSPLEAAAKLLQSQSYDEEAESLPGVIQFNSIEPRKNLDFTDKLWTVLIGCKSYPELLGVMNLVVKSVSTKQCSPLMVSGSNTNPLAKWIHSCQQGELEGVPMLDLGGIQALAYFIEMGIERLTKDYVHTYLANFAGLVTPDKLDKYTNRSSPIQERLTNLSKLHSVLELAALLHSFIRLPLAAVRSATASALRHLSDHSSLPSEGFKLNTSVGSISNIISTQTPEIWEVTVGGNQNTNKVVIRINKTEPDHSVILSTSDKTSEDIFYCSIIKQQDISDVL